MSEEIGDIVTGATEVFSVGVAGLVPAPGVGDTSKYLQGNGTWSTVSGGVTNVATGTGLTGGPITGTGTISLADTAVIPGAYTNSSITVDAQGRITSASSGIAGANTTLSNLSPSVAISEDLRFPLASTKTVRLAKDIYLTGRNSTNTGDIDLIKVDAFNRTTISSGAALPILIERNIYPAANNNYALGIASVAFSEVNAKNFILANASEFAKISDAVTTPSGIASTIGFRTTGGVVSPVSIFTSSDANANATATGILYLESGNKTAGTGASGLISLLTGTSLGGATGAININTGAKTGTQSAANTGAVTIASGLSSTSSAGVTTGAVTLQSGNNSAINAGGTGNVIVQSGTGGGGGTGPTGTLLLQTGDATQVGGGSTGAVTLKSGNRTNFATASGILTIATGSSGSGTSGAITFGTGNALSGTGNVTIQTGVGSSTSSTGNTGTLNITTGAKSGTQTNNSGIVTIQSGDNSSSSTGTTGAVTLKSGTKTIGTAVSGDVTVISGNATGNSGEIILQTGTSGATRGNISLNAPLIDAASSGAFKLPSAASAPASPAAGWMYYDTVTNKSYTYDGTAWQAHF